MTDQPIKPTMLAQLQPVMHRLGIWPRELSKVDDEGLDHSFYYDCDMKYGRSGIDDQHALDIIIRASERWLYSNEWGSYKLRGAADFWYKAGASVKHSMLEALEWETENNEQPNK